MLSSLVTFTGEIADTKVVLPTAPQKEEEELIDKQTRAVCEAVWAVNVSYYHPLLYLSFISDNQIAMILNWTKLKWWIDSDLQHI